MVLFVSEKVPATHRRPFCLSLIKQSTGLSASTLAGLNGVQKQVGVMIYGPVRLSGALELVWGAAWQSAQTLLPKAGGWGGSSQSLSQTFFVGPSRAHGCGPLSPHSSLNLLSIRCRKERKSNV